MSLIKIPKIIIIGFLGALLWAALLGVLGTVSERSHRRGEVYTELAQSTTGSQVLAGPILVLPYEIMSQSTMIDATGVKQTKSETVKHERIILPKKLLIHGSMAVERRYRSLYEILLYQTQLKLEGSFEFDDPRDLNAPPGSTLRKLPPYLVVLVRDSRGLTATPILRWNRQVTPVRPGKNDLVIGGFEGFHSLLPSAVESGGTFPFSIDMVLRGTESMNWVPVGEETRIVLQANWPHPNFQGRALPKSHRITAAGFEAEWESTHFSSGVAPLMGDISTRANLDNQKFGIKLMQPVDIYSQTERSVKYGFLLVALTFAAFFALETLKQLAIHPIQYGLVGLALVLFYVLLLALSEHMVFVWAYCIASFASIALLTFYIRYVLHSWKDAFCFGASLIGLYGAIYWILRSEDYALLLGAGMLFGLLAAAMIGTRQVDWNRPK